MGIIQEQSYSEPIRQEFTTHHIGRLGKGQYIYFARNRSEFLQALRLVHAEYCRLGYCTDDRVKIHYGMHTLTRHCSVLNYVSDGRVVATLSRIHDSVEFGLPMDCLYQKELDELRASGRAIVECGSLASIASGKNRLAAVELIHSVIMSSLRDGFDDICIIVNPKHVKFYQRLYPCEVFGPERHYDRVNAPAVPIRLDLHTCKRLEKKYGKKVASFSDVDKVVHLKDRNVSFMCSRTPTILDGPRYVPEVPLVKCLLQANPSLARTLRLSQLSQMVA